MSKERQTTKRADEVERLKILVTGGAGFIGSHVVDAYIREGWEVVVVDDLSSGKKENIHPEATFYLMDIRSPDLQKVFALERPDVVNHHAAQKSVPLSVEDPILDADLNVIGLLNVLNQCVAHEVKKCIFISSGGALAGDAAVIPTDEDTMADMIAPYAISKYVGEKYLHFYAVTHGLSYVSLRYANVYGPRQVPEGECGVVPIFMNNFLAGKPSELFTYADMPRGTTRDYVYVDDVARANVLAATKGENVALNIGTGVEMHIADIYEQMREVLGHDLPLIRKSERVGDVRRSCLDCTRAKDVLGWEAQVTFKEGIKRLYEYMRAH